MNPLFPSDDQSSNHDAQDNGYVLPGTNDKRLEPLSDKKSDRSSPAVELIRRKIDAMYGGEPSPSAEFTSTKQQEPEQRSKHQQFMYELSTSGKPLAQIQTEWHNYYASLSDAEKHQIWQEFYQANSKQPSAHATHTPHKELSMPTPHPPETTLSPYMEEPAPKVMMPKPTEPPAPPAVRRRNVAEVKKQVLRKVRARNQVHIKAKQHFQSLLFGLGTGALVLLILLFSFFNEVVIAPFIRPGSQTSATPIILSTDSVAPSETPEIIIPKINAQIPVVYGSAGIDESTIQKSLEEGVIHYPSTALPGQKSNAAFFGHSSNNIFNKGKFKFAFVLLHELVPGDIFYVTYDKKVYAYRVYDKKIVNPDEVWVLNPVPDKVATATLITCDPPGTSLRRLVVWGEQISPDPNGNIASAPPLQTNSEDLPSEGPTLWGRFRNWLFN